MNWRAVGCLLVGSVAFVAIGLLGLSLATSRTGCFDSLQASDGVYRAAGGVTASPSLRSGEAPTKIGTTLVGIATRDVYGPQGTDVNDPDAPRPTQIAVDCGDGTFQAYELEPGPPDGS